MIFSKKFKVYRLSDTLVEDWEAPLLLFEKSPNIPAKTTRNKDMVNRRFTNRYFWRTWDKQEVDFVEEEGGKFEAVEIKWGKAKRFPPKAWRGNYPNSIWKGIDKSNYWEFIR